MCNNKYDDDDDDTKGLSDCPGRSNKREVSGPLDIKCDELGFQRSMQTSNPIVTKDFLTLGGV